MDAKLCSSSSQLSIVGGSYWRCIVSCTHTAMVKCRRLSTASIHLHVICKHRRRQITFLRLWTLGRCNDAMSHKHQMWRAGHISGGRPCGTIASGQSDWLHQHPDLVALMAAHRGGKACMPLVTHIIHLLLGWLLDRVPASALDSSQCSCKTRPIRPPVARTRAASP